jgi:hypothetical protein
MLNLSIGHWSSHSPANQTMAKDEERRAKNEERRSLHVALRRAETMKNNHEETKSTKVFSDLSSFPSFLRGCFFEEEGRMTNDK